MHRFSVVFYILLSGCAGHGDFGGPDGEAPNDGGGSKDEPFQQGDSGGKFGDSQREAPIGDGGGGTAKYGVRGAETVRAGGQRCAGRRRSACGTETRRREPEQGTAWRRGAAG